MCLRFSLKTTSSPEECEAFPTFLIPESLEILWLHYEEAALLGDTCFCAEEGAGYLHDIIMLEDVFYVLAHRHLLGAVVNILSSHQMREVWKIVNRYEINLLAILVCIKPLEVSLFFSHRLHGSILILDVRGVRVLILGGCIGCGVRAEVPLELALSEENPNFHPVALSAFLD